MLRADVAWLSGLCPEPPQPLTALAGDRDPLAAPETMAQWGRHAAGQFDLRVVSGGHLFRTTSADAATSLIKQDIAFTRGDPHEIR